MIEDRRFVIQRTPTGLLDLLGMQSTGDLPHTIQQSVQSVLDVTDLYTIDRLQRSSAATGVINAIGFWTAGIGPAPGEQWLVSSLNITSGALAAASSISWCFAVLRQGLSTQGQLFDYGRLISGTAAFADGQLFTPKPVILRPGDVLGIQVGAITGVPAVAPFVTAFFTSLKI